MHKDIGLESLHDNSEGGSGSAINQNDIEIQLEDALIKEQKKVVPTSEDSDQKPLHGLHNSRFFIDRVDDNSLGDTHEKEKLKRLDEPEGFMDNIRVNDFSSGK